MVYPTLLTVKSVRGCCHFAVARETSRSIQQRPLLFDRLPFPSGYCGVVRGLERPRRKSVAWSCPVFPYEGGPGVSAPQRINLTFCFRHKLDTNLYKLVPGLLIRLRYRTMPPSTASTYRDIEPEVDLEPRSQPENGPDSDATVYTVHRRPNMSSETRKKFINYPLPIPG